MGRYFPTINPNSDYSRTVALNNYYIDRLIEQGISINDIPAILKSKSIETLVIELGKDPEQTRSCNYNCKICFTKDRHGINGINLDIVRKVIDEVTQLGCRTVQIPGIGEPANTKSFWELLDHLSTTDNRLEVVLYTNGTFAYDTEVANYLDERNLDLISKLKRHGRTNIYVKFWTTNPNKSEKYYGVKTDFELRDGIYIPRSLAILMDRLDRSRVGIQVAVFDDNYEEFVDNILPFALRHNLICFAEQIMPVKNAMGYSLSADNKREVIEHLTAGNDYCKERLAREAILNIDTLTPCIQFPRLPRHRITTETSIFELFHSPDFREIRKKAGQLNCVCEELLKGRIEWK